MRPLEVVSVLLIVLVMTWGTLGMVGNKLKVVKEWKQLDFEFPDEETRIQALNSGKFIPGNSFPIDVDVHYEGGNTRIFVTVPRNGPGRPFTLATVAGGQGQQGQLLKAYPDYSWHDRPGEDCDGMTSVFRVAIDKCSRLWVLDTGMIGDSPLCSPQLLAFDLKTDTLILRHKISNALRPDSFLITPVIDVRDGCQDTFVYIADVVRSGLIVYDMTNDRSWRVESNLFYPHPEHGTFTIAGESFDLMDGVFGLALSPYKGTGSDRTLYFHSLAAVTENFVLTSVIRNSTAWESPSTVDRKLFKTFRQKRISQSAAQAMDRNGVMYFGLLSQRAIACWNSATDYSPSNMDLVALDPVRLQFPSGVKVAKNLKGEQELWVLTCRFQRIMTGTMTASEINFRIMAAKTKDLVSGTKCDRPSDLVNFVEEGSPLSDQ